MPGRCIAIGDIHGCSRALGALLAAISPTSEDVVVTLGDVLDRGPDSRRTIDRLIELSQNCCLKGVLGNHEEMLLSVIRGDTPPMQWVKFGGAATLDSYGFQGDLSVIPREHLKFLESFVDYVEAERHFFVHANYDPQIPLDRQSPSHLRWLSLNESFPSRHLSGKTAIVGHTAERSGEVFSSQHLKCIDTYCYGGGWLTAYDVDTGFIWQANESEVVRVRPSR